MIDRTPHPTILTTVRSSEESALPPLTSKDAQLQVVAQKVFNHMQLSQEERSYINALATKKVGILTQFFGRFTQAGALNKLANQVFNGKQNYSDLTKKSAALVKQKEFRSTYQKRALAKMLLVFDSALQGGERSAARLAPYIR